MFCKNCGIQMNDGASFCPSCGTRTSVQSAPAQESYTPVQENYVPAQETYYNYENQQSYDAVSEVSYAANAAKKKKKGPLTAVIVVVAVVVIGAVLYFTGALSPVLSKMGVTSPAWEVIEAAKKTVFETESLTVNTGDEVIKIKFGEDVESSAFLIGDDDEYYCGMYDGVVYVYEDGTYDVDDFWNDAAVAYEEAFDIDLEDAANNLINKKIDEKAFEDIYNTAIRNYLVKMYKSQYIRNLYYNDEIDSLEPYCDEDGALDFDKIDATINIPDYDETMKILKKFFTKGLTEDAVEVEKDGNTYKFDVDAAEFMTCLLDFIKENDDVKDIVEKIAALQYDDVDDFYDDFEDSIDSLEEDDPKIKIEAEVESGRLVYLEVKVDGDKVFELEITDVNKTEIDKDDVEDIDTEDDYYYDYSYDDYYYDDYYYDDYYYDDYYYDDYYDYYY